MSAETPPAFTAQQTPGEILNQAGGWLARQLGDEFRWLRGQRSLTRARGTRTDQIRLQPSRWNRAGLGTWATIRVTVRDTALAAWRRRHPGDTLFGHDPDLLWTIDFINVDRNLYFVELFGHLQTTGDVPQLSLSRLLAGTRSILIPLLDAFASPQAAAADLPDSALVMAPSLVEWAISNEDLDSARRIVERMIRIHLSDGSGFEMGRGLHSAGKKPDFALGEEVWLGWLAARFGLFSAAEPLPWSVPPKSERERVTATGRSLAERLRSELRHFQDTRPGRIGDEQVVDLLRCLGSWVKELAGQPSLAEAPSVGGLATRVTGYGIAATELGSDLIAFEDAAARLR